MADTKVSAFTAARAGVEGGAKVRGDDPFFAGVSDELADKGFVVAKLDDAIAWARTGSLMFMSFGLAWRVVCCDFGGSLAVWDVAP